MKVLVVGSTGGTGRAVVERLLADGHEVTAFTRRAGAFGAADRLHTFEGDAMALADVERAVKGQDAVVVTLGISESPLRVRLFGPAHTPIDVRSAGTRNVIAAMRAQGVRRLVVLTTYGVGTSRERLRLLDRLFFALLLRPQIADTELQHQAVVASDLDWVLVQPVHLTGSDDDPMPLASSAGTTGKMSVSRRSVARFIAHALAHPELARSELAISDHAAAARALPAARPSEAEGPARRPLRGA